MITRAIGKDNCWECVCNCNHVRSLLLDCVLCIRVTSSCFLGRLQKGKPGWLKPPKKISCRTEGERVQHGLVSEQQAGFEPFFNHTLLLHCLQRHSGMTKILEMLFWILNMEFSTSQFMSLFPKDSERACQIGGSSSLQRVYITTTWLHFGIHPGSGQVWRCLQNGLSVFSFASVFIFLMVSVFVSVSVSVLAAPWHTLRLR